jgi:hypothetical protein
VTAAPDAGPKRAASFGRVLEEVEGAYDASEGLGRPFEVPVIAMLSPGEARSDEAGAAWDQALAFVESTRPPPAADPAPAPPAAPPSDDADSIAAELDLAAATNASDLRRARRRFMWANHPDRRPDVSPELANRRVAIANMLVDRAEAALASPPEQRRGRR